MTKLPFYVLWRGSSGWKLSDNFREVIAPQMGLKASDLERIEEVGRAFNDQRTRPSDAEVRDACSEAVDHAQRLYRAIKDLPRPVRLVLMERMGVIPFMEHLLGRDAPVQAFVRAATLTRPRARPHDDPKSVLHLQLLALHEDINARPGGSLPADVFVEHCMHEIAPDLPVTARKTWKGFMERVRKGNKSP